MDENIDTNVAVLAMLNNQCQSSEPAYKTSHMINYHSHNHVHTMSQSQSQDTHVLNPGETECLESSKQSTVWTKSSTLALLNLYENKMNIHTNPKKKSKMWLSMSEELKAMGIEVTPDQVRWKINALTKKYRDCIDNGQDTPTFKYFNEMHQILGRCDDKNSLYRIASGVKQTEGLKDKSKRLLSLKEETPYRRLRVERRNKIEIDKLWIEYIQKQDEQRIIRDERYERCMKLREEELQLRRKELEIKQSIALKKLQLKERKQEEILKIEREKCILLRKLLGNQ